MGMLGVAVKAFVLEMRAALTVMNKADVFMVCIGFYCLLRLSVELMKVMDFVGRFSMVCFVVVIKMGWVPTAVLVWCLLCATWM